MIRQFPKDHDEQLSEHFFLREFRCHCVLPECKSTYVSEELIEAGQSLRDLIGQPIQVLSGFRCPAHNKSVGGKADSNHMLGIAMDMACRGKTPFDLKRGAQRVLGFSQGGIGLYSWGIHGDVRGKPARWIG